jgi:N-acetylneuraminate lyase
VADFRGIMPALLTPFDAQGEVSRSALHKLVNFLLDSGASGFYVNGTTGEGLLLSLDERKVVLETVLDVVNERVPVIAHVGALSTRDAVDLTRHAASVGAAAVAAIPPIYYAVDLAAIKEHYSQIARAARGLPLWLYHIPGSTGVNLTPAQFVELLKIDGVKGIKFSAHNYFDMRKILEYGQDIVGQDFRVLNGSDELLLPALLMGAHGAVGSTYNVLTAHFVRLYNAYTTGDIAQAQALQYDANQIIGALLSVPHIAALKAILRDMDIDCGEPRAPLRPLTEAEQSLLTDLLEKTTFKGQHA